MRKIGSNAKLAQQGRRGDMRLLYQELRAEVDFLLRADPGKPDEPTRYPDPTRLSPMQRRIVVRSIFAAIEGIVFGMKALALDSPSGVSALSSAEQALAAEEGYDLADSGEPISRPARLRLASNIRFAFRLLAKVDGAAHVLDFSGPGWQALQRAIKLRDRLMHPKHFEDLNVADEEIRDAARAFIWFEQEIILVLVSSVKALRVEQRRLLEATKKIVNGLA